MRIRIILLMSALLFGVLSQAQTCEDLLVAVQENQTDKVEKILKTVKPNCYHDGNIQPRTPLGMVARKGNLTLPLQN